MKGDCDNCSNTDECADQIKEAVSLLDRHCRRRNTSGGDSDISGAVAGTAKFIGLAIIAIVIVVILTSCIAIVPAGTVGIQNTWGSVDDNTLEPGLHFKSPFTDVVPMSVQTQKYIDYGTNDVASIDGLSNEGLKISLGMTMNYRLDPSKAVEVYKRVGTSYDTKILRDPIHTVPRDVISQYDAKTLYSASSAGTADRLIVEQRIGDGIRDRINNVGVPNSIIIEQVYIRNIQFPDAFANARTDQLTMETKITTKSNEVKVQEMEAQRQVAEARGIADANHIISGSLTESYLQWYWIQSMEKNPKAIYVPSNNGMPLFKNVDNTT